MQIFLKFVLKRRSNSCLILVKEAAYSQEISRVILSHGKIVFFTDPLRNLTFFRVQRQLCLLELDCFI